jgi:hypothetical protein
MKEGAFTPRIIGKNLLVHGPSAKVDFRFCKRRATASAPIAVVLHPNEAFQ